MKLYTTEIKAIDPTSGELCSYAGPHVPGLSFADADHYCQTNGLGYCKVVGQLVAEIPCKPGTLDPDFDRMIDYEQAELN